MLFNKQNLHISFDIVVWNVRGKMGTFEPIFEKKIMIYMYLKSHTVTFICGLNYNPVVHISFY